MFSIFFKRNKENIKKNDENREDGVDDPDCIKDWCLYIL